jgi:hypothetical protein
MTNYLCNCGSTVAHLLTTTRALALTKWWCIDCGTQSHQDYDADGRCESCARALAAEAVSR